MANLFNWDEQVICGEEETPSCAALDYSSSVKALRASHKTTGCEIDFISQQYPAIPCLIGDNQTDGRSGSVTYPIPLNKVQTYTGDTVPELFFRNVAGQLSAWNPPLSCDNHRVILQDGNFTHTPDINSNVFAESCIGSIDDVDYIAGGVTFTDCNGDTKLKLVFFPKASLCDYCDALES